MKQSFLLIFLCYSLNITAQKQPLLKNSKSIKPDIEKVVRDYFDHFYNIKGEKLDETKSTIEYQSKVVPYGASESTITEIKGLKDVFSWQATLMDTDDFGKAVEEYKKLYHELSGANYLMYDKANWKFSGAYDTPTEERAFASSILEPDVSEKSIKHLKIEIALNYSMPDWTVKVLVYEKESDAEIRPTGIVGQQLY